MEILEIGDLSRDRFRGIFRLTYAGDAHLVLSTKVQANPLSKPTPQPSSSSGSDPDGDTFMPFATASATRGILFAAAPLIVPMQLRLSHVRLRAIIVLVVSKTKGITLVFKNDPLESVQVSSTFDSVAVIAKYLQQEIEGQLKEVFREDLPGIIHRLSQKWLSGTGAKAKKAEGDGSKYGQPTKSSGETAVVDGETSAEPPASVAASKRSRKKSSTGTRKASSDVSGPSRSPKSAKGRSSSKSRAEARPPMPTMPSSQSTPALRIQEEDDEPFEIPLPISTSFDDIESYDPTYGLRPDEVRLPKKGQGFRGLKQLRRAGPGSIIGLGGLLEEEPPNQAELDWLAAQRSEEAVGEGNEGLDDDADEADAHSVQRGHSEWAEDDGLELEEELPESFARSAGDDVDDQADDDVSSSSSSASSSSAQQQLSDPDDAPGDFSRFGYPPASAAFSDTADAFERESRRANSVFGTSPNKSKRTKGRATMSDLIERGSDSAASSSRRGGTGGPRSVTGVGLSTGSAVERAASVFSAGSRGKSASSVGMTSSVSLPRLLPSRPRVFHASSLIRPPDPSVYGGSDVDETWDASSQHVRGLTGGSSTIGPRSHRTESVGGGSTLGRSGPGSSRTFTIRSRRNQGGSLLGRGAASPLHQGGSDFFDRPEFEESAEEDLEEEALDTLGDEMAFNSSTPSHSNSTPSMHSSSKAGTLATLEPEPMDESSPAFRKMVQREQHGGKEGLYRPGWQIETLNTVKPSPRRTQSSTTTPKPSNGAARPPLHSRSTNSRVPGKAGPTGPPPRLHLQDLVHSNQTLSPYTRLGDTRGWATRSMPATPGGLNGSSPASASLVGSEVEEAASTGSGGASGKQRTFRFGQGQSVGSGSGSGSRA